MDDNINNINNTVEDTTNEDRKGIFLATVGIMTIIVAIAGATYAFFAASVSNNAITGQSGYEDIQNALSLSVTMVSNGTGKLIPQNSENDAINAAAVGSGSSQSCIDGNGNTICKVYKITISNTKSIKLNVRGTLTITEATTGSMPNLRWAMSTSSATSGFGTANEISTTSLADTSLAATSGTYTVYVIIWIEETGSEQTDSGSFSGKVEFIGYAGGETQGVSSTITG